MTVNHYVMFRLQGDRPEVTAAAIRFKEAIEALVFRIPELIEASVSLNENPAESWTMILMSKVASWDDLALYAAHPAHQGAVDIIRPMIAARAAVDYVS